jgi:hypothetical protein
MTMRSMSGFEIGRKPTSTKPNEAKRIERRRNESTQALQTPRLYQGHHVKQEQMVSCNPVRS